MITLLYAILEMAVTVFYNINQYFYKKEKVNIKYFFTVSIGLCSQDMDTIYLLVLLYYKMKKNVHSYENHVS